MADRARTVRELAPARAPSSGGAPAPWLRGDGAIGVGLAALATLLYAATSPAVVNLDGLGYLKLLPHNFAAGHLLYMPLLRLAARLRGDELAAGRLLSALAGGAAVGLAYVGARALVGRGAALFAAAGLALSYASWVQGADVEVYALALAATQALLVVALAYRAAPSTPRALALGLLLAIAVLVHLTHLVATLFVAAWIVTFAATRRRALWHLAAALLVAGATTLAAYAWAALIVRRHDLAAAARWLASAGHGFVDQGSLFTRLADAARGLARSLVGSPHGTGSDGSARSLHGLLGLAPLLVLASLALSARRHAPGIARLHGLWIAAYAAIALAFFGADHERWLFTLPSLWLLAARRLEALRPAPAIALGLALLTYLGLANAVTAIAPAQHDAGVRARADAAAALMRDGDLVLFPGHAWDEYIGFYTGLRLRPVPLVYYLALRGVAGTAAHLDWELREARARGARVFAVRLFDPAGGGRDEPGFVELDGLGLSRQVLRDLVARFIAVPLPTTDPQTTVFRLDEPAR